MREVDSHEQNILKVAFAINQLIRGRGNNIGTMTLKENVTTTTITPDKRVMNSSATVLPIPRTANASAEWAGGAMYLSEVTKTTFTFTHANNSQTDRTFDYVIIGG